MHSRAADLTPNGHPDKPHCLNNLGNAFRARFVRLGQLSDLENAIFTQRDAVDLIPNDHPDKPNRLNSLGSSFLTRFWHLGQLSDLEDAILRQRDAVDLIPSGHPRKPGYLNNLGVSFKTRFKHVGQLSDLEDAISMQREAVSLTPNGHRDKPIILTHLGSSFLTRFEHLGRLSDLEEAISAQRDAVDITPNGHPSKTLRLYNHGHSFLARFEYLGQLSDMENAIFLYSYAASDYFGPTKVRFDASRKWISCARHIRHHSLLHAYSVAMNLLPQLAWNGLSLSHRYTELARGADVAREAAAVALESGLPEIAVEWLEQGRSIVWGDLYQLRSSYEDLLSAHPDHARRLRELSTALDHASAAREKALSTLSEQTQNATTSLQKDADRHRRLAIERDKLLQDIRKLPGFERFLLRKEFSRLRASAHSGPVVILNAAESRCDALIVLANVDHVIHVPLSNFSFQRSIGLQNALHSLRDAREGKPKPSARIEWNSFLSPLWKCIVKPVLDAVAFSVRHIV